MYSKNIVLGYPLDLLLNRKCEFITYQGFIVKDEIVRKPISSNTYANQLKPGESNKFIGGIALPTENNPGTGNIIIRGRPGTAKSTLALQLAVASAHHVNNCISIFISLEETPENIIYKSKLFGWDNYCRIMKQLCNLEDSESADQYGNLLRKILTQPDNCRLYKNEKTDDGICRHHTEVINDLEKIKSKVLITSLTPRSIFKRDAGQQSLFMERYCQLEKLLEAAYIYNKAAYIFNKEHLGADVPRISFVCIDSINVLGDDLLPRNELFRLFDLFKRYGIIGVFVLEEDERNIYHPESKIHGNTIEYLSDMVISLSVEEDNGYTVRYFEISKSRYQHQVYGKHPFKLQEVLFPEVIKEIVKKLNELKAGQSFTVDYDYLKDNLQFGEILINNLKQEIKEKIYPELTLRFDTDIQFSLKRDELMSVIEGCSVNHLTTGIKFTKNGKEKGEKTDKSEESGELLVDIPFNSIEAVKVFPSLHYIVFGTDSSSAKPDPMKSVDEVFFAQDMGKILPPNFELPGAVLIEGPRATFKTSLAGDFMMKGFLSKGKTHVIFILFHDEVSQIPCKGKKFRSFRLTDICHREILAQMKEFKIEELIKFVKQDTASDLNDDQNSILKDLNDLIKISPTRDLEYFLTNSANEIIKEITDKELGLRVNSFFEKYSMNFFWNMVRLSEFNSTKKRFMYSWVYKDSDSNEKRFTELIIKSGYILPEEFIQLFLETFNFFEVKPGRIVLDEIGCIGSAYPLLNKSRSSGELFLTAVVHIIRNYQTGLMMTGTTGEYDKADNVIDQAKTLVDSTLTTSNINIFGDNYIKIIGEGLVSSESPAEEVKEKIPAAIIPLSNGRFKIDVEKFNGLVGFESNKISRPGICLYLFEEHEIQAEYNRDIYSLLSYAFGTSVETVKKQWESDVEISPFGREETTSLHDSLRFLEGKPIEKTIICSIDEFCKEEVEISRSSLLPINDEIVKRHFGTSIRPSVDNQFYTLPYYDNVLVVAYNENLCAKHNLEIDFKTWETFSTSLATIEKNTPDSKLILIDFIPESGETLSCLFLDAIISNLKAKKIDFFDSAVEKINSNKKFRDKLSRSLIALRRIVRLSARSMSWMGYGNKQDSDFNYNENNNKNTKPLLVSNSLVYICWYSELRNLLSHNPELSNQIRIRQLPGNGFKGDWHLGILKGSVSASLGNKVLNILCSEKEDIKRYVRGVGLPTTRFYNKPNEELNGKANFLAWPGSNLPLENDKTQLSTLFRFHDEANERSKIKNYTNLRLIFVNLFNELIMLDDETKTETVIVNRIPGLVNRIRRRNNVNENLT